MILNETNDIYHFVGGLNTPTLPAAATPYEMSVEYAYTPDTTYVVTHVRIFADVEGAPVYQIVVGESPTRSPEQLIDLRAKRP
jgi:hypothetical protein